MAAKCSRWKRLVIVLAPLVLACGASEDGGSGGMDSAMMGDDGNGDGGSAGDGDGDGNGDGGGSMDGAPTTSDPGDSGDSDDDGMNGSGDGPAVNCDNIVATGIDVGDVPPDFTLQDALGGSHTLYEHCGNVILVIAGAQW